MLKSDQQGLEGNDRWEGFMVDMIAELSKMLGFNYTFKKVDDDRYGQLINGTWNGMIGEIIDGKADIAASDVTITSMRENVVDFTMPFMNVGIGILYKKKHATYDMEYLLNSICGGSQKDGLVEDPAVRSIEDLAYQSGPNKIAFGAIEGGATNHFFKRSTLPTLKAIASQMSNVKSTKEAVERVKAGGYAFFMESSNIDYVLERDCELYQAGCLLDSKGFGLVVANDSPYRALLSDGILQLQEAGFLRMLKDKWWSADGRCKV